MNADLSAADTVGKPNRESNQVLQLLHHTVASLGRPLLLTVVTRNTISVARPLSLRDANLGTR